MGVFVSFRVLYDRLIPGKSEEPWAWWESSRRVIFLHVKLFSLRDAIKKKKTKTSIVAENNFLKLDLV